jgi:methylthioxylose transferase
VQLVARSLAVPRVVARDAVVALAVGGIVLAGHALGVQLEAHDPRVHIGAPPFVGAFRRQLTWRLAAPAGLAGTVVLAGPWAARVLPWRWLAAATAAVAAAWAGLLGWCTGSLSAPLASPYDLLTAVPAAQHPLAFLRHFTSDLPAYSTHVRGHPPGGVLLLAALDRLHLGGPGWAAALCIAAGSLAAPLALIAHRQLGGDARAAAPFLALAPGAVWVATSFDALYMGVGAAALCLVCLRRDLLAGLVFGAGLMLSYGLAPLALPLALLSRSPRRLLWIAAGGVAVLGAFALAGFWWTGGLAATHRAAFAGVLARRPYGDFLVINVAALALAVGPAAWRWRGSAPVGWVAAAVVATDLLGVTRGETERVWLVFVPWLLLAAGGRGRGWLGVQAALALALQAGVRSPW